MSSEATAAPLAGVTSFARALWGLNASALALPPPANEFAPRRPRFAANCIWLPSSPLAGVSAGFSDYLLAAAAHAAAHLRFGAARFLVKSLKPAQIAIVSLIEDARVERLARRQYPGLARLWAPFHLAQASGAKTSGALFARLARALHDDDHVDDDAWVQKGRALFLNAQANWQDSSISRSIGGILGNDLGQMRAQFSAKDYAVQPPYRDDNLGLWQFEHDATEEQSELELEGARRIEDDQRPPTRQTSAQGLPNTRNATEPLQADAAPGVCLEEVSAAESPLLYAEWDYVIARERAAFCRLYERPARVGNASSIDLALARYGSAKRLLERSALRLGSQRPAPLRRLLDGDRLDLPATIAAQVASVSGQRPDPRVYRRTLFKREPPAMLLLLDLSQSLNAQPADIAAPLLELARTASALLASTLPNAARGLAIHGFASNGREDVRYYRFKDFDEPYGQGVQARLAGMRASLSTRLGTALRHAGHLLEARRAQRKSLLVVTDGEPSDIDSHDPRYLLLEAKHATLRNRQRGVSSFCVGLDSTAERSVQRIFGPGNYLLLDRLDALPLRLSQLYQRLSA